MRTFGKQILQAFILGCIIPLLILTAMVKLDKDRPQVHQTESTEQTAVSTAANSETLFALYGNTTIPVQTAPETVCTMELEEYICGVVLAEMPADFELEALKAQSVVARTYALRRNLEVPKHPQGAVCTDPSCCQGYLSNAAYYEKGGVQSGIDKIRQAVLATAGEVLTFDGKFIEATYFSCSGGMTEDAAAVWGSDIPYLRSTESPGEEFATHYTDTVILTPGEVEDKMEIWLSGDPDTWFVPTQYTAGGGVAEMLVCGESYSGVELRSLLGLRSTNFTVDASADAVTITTYGYGHRVGMSQYGADAMALEGKAYQEILAHYYQGTKLENYTHN